MKTKTILLMLLALILSLAACDSAVVEEDMPETETAVPAEPTPSPTKEPAELTEEMLKNMAYQGIYDEPVILEDGQFEGEPFVEDSASRPTISFIPMTAFGDLNKDGIDDAAVLLMDTPGGSGTFVYLAAVLNQDGQPENVATTLLGDRVAPESLAIVDGDIVLEAATHAETDPMCCPSLLTRTTYALQNGELTAVTTKTLAQTISGQVVVRGKTEGVDLPAGSQIIVQVQDTSLADAPATVLGEQIIDDATSLPVGYQIKVDPAQLEAAAQASVAARVEDADGNLLYINDTIHPVTTDDAFVDVELIAVEPSPEEGDSAFDGIVWQWLRFEDSASGEESNDITVDNPAKYTLKFMADGTYMLQADCNNGSGSYSIDGSSISLEPGPITLAACGPDSLDSEFLSRLGDVVTFVFDQAGNLVLNLKADAGNMIFARAAAASSDLEGTSWVLSGILADDVAESSQIDAEITAVFQDGQLTGSAGCNNYFTNYETDSPSLTLGPVGSTKMACDEARNQREMTFLTALGNVTSYNLAGNTLELLDAEGNLLIEMTAQTASNDVTWCQFAGTGATIAIDDKRANFTCGSPETVLLGDIFPGEDGWMIEKAALSHSDDGFTADSIEQVIVSHIELADGTQCAWAGTGATIAIDQKRANFTCGSPETVLLGDIVPGEEGWTIEKAVISHSEGGFAVEESEMALITALGVTTNEGQMDEATSIPALDMQTLQLDTTGVAPSWNWVAVPEKPYDQSMPPGPAGLPAHIEILFGDSGAAEHQPGEPILYLIPVKAYQQMWDRAGNTAVTDALAQIAERTYITNAPGSVAALPFEEIRGAKDLTVQLGRAVPFGQLNETSATQSGYRFIGRWAQDANPVTNQNLFYVYQGFTNDGRYLVAFFHPISTDALPPIEDVPQDEFDRLANDYDAYMAEKTELLNELDSADFTPNLAALDALIASLEIEGMPISGLQGKTWQWTSGPAQPGSSEIITIDNPELYQVTYQLDGMIEVTADCNLANLSYELRQGGLNGSMLAMPGPMTLAECGPDSHYQAFISSLGAAQNFRVFPGGDEMELILPAGGGVLQFIAANAN